MEPSMKFYSKLILFLFLSHILSIRGIEPSAVKKPAAKKSLSMEPKRPTIEQDSFVQCMVDCVGDFTNIPPWKNVDLVKRALAIQVGAETNAWIVFDTEKLEYTIGWLGSLALDRTSIQRTAQGSLPATISGDVKFRHQPGAAGDAKDPDRRKFKGFHISNREVTLEFEIEGRKTYDIPGFKMLEGVPSFFHTVYSPSEGKHKAIALNDQTEPPPPAGGLLPLETNLRGGTNQWQPDIRTSGQLGMGAGAYVVDTVTVPETNRWNSWMRLSGLDFFSDGRCAVCTMSGDVWIVTGIEGKLENCVWKRFATGLFEPLGLKIRDEQIYVLGRDRITRLHDVNNDDKADFYESFNSGWDVFPTYHAFNMDLQTDSKGNFYFNTCGNMVDPDLPMHGTMLKVSSDGKTCEVFCSGMRAANGMGIGPNDEITAADNQGHWTPSSRINWCKPGGFYGYGGDPRYTNFTAHPIMRKTPDSYDPPLCWLPMKADNSSGGQVWVTSDKWGGLKNHLLHTSYGKCTLFAIMPEEVEGVWQGGAVQFPLKFASGIMRARFNALDGQLYVAGMKGWQTSAARDGCLQRVRYTGNALNMPAEMHVKPKGIELTFAGPLDPASANDVQSFGIVEYNYLWSKEYGSADYKVSKPKEKGRDPVEIKSARLQPNGKTVFLEIPNLQAVMQMEIKYDLQAADGSRLEQEIFNTINKVPAPN
jgi:hypothetical protein